MGSITQSPDRVAQVVSGSLLQQGGAGDSALQPTDSNPIQVVEQAFTGISAAEIVYESRQQYSSVSEGVASAGHPAQPSIDRMDEFVPGAFEAPVSAAGGYEGETSGGNFADPAGGSNGDLGDTGEALRHPSAVHKQLGGGTLLPPRHQPPPSPMDFQTTASAQVGPSTVGKRKSSFEVSDSLEPKRAEGADGLHRVPSDLAMVTGLSDGEADPAEAPLWRAMDATDSNIAGIRAGVAAAGTVFDQGDTAEAAMPDIHAPDAFIADAQVETEFPAGQQQQQPTDADIIDWVNKIKEEQSVGSLIGDIEPLAALEDEYRAGNDIFLTKIHSIQRKYTAIRRTRGDGNCFFRSFVFSYLESILMSMDIRERDKAIHVLDVTIRKRLLDAKYDEFILETPLDLLLSMLRSIGSSTDPLTLDALESNMRSEEVSNYIVFLLRMITSAEIKRRADFFEPFILGLSDMGVQTFCQKCVDPMGEESDHVQMVALTDALQVSLRVVYLDRSLAMVGSFEDHGIGGEQDTALDHKDRTNEDAPLGGMPMMDTTGTGQGISFASVAPGGAASTAGTVVSAVAGGGGGGGPAVRPSAVKVDMHDFLPEGMSEEPRVHLLYRPGHYDALYPRY